MTATYDGTATDLETRAEIASLEALHHERRQLLPEYSALRALHGPGNKWDNRRKAFLETQKIKARMECQQKGEKVTESLVDALGHADEEYVKLIDEGIASATRYVELEIMVNEINERIMSRLTELSAYSSEARLGR